MNARGDASAKGLGGRACTALLVRSLCFSGLRRFLWCAALPRLALGFLQVYVRTPLLIGEPGAGGRPVPGPHNPRWS